MSLIFGIILFVTFCFGAEIGDVEWILLGLFYIGDSMKDIKGK